MGALADTLLDAPESGYVHFTPAQRELLMERFFSMSLDLMCVANSNGYFRIVNPAFDKLGYSAEELVSRPFLDFVHPEDVAATLAEVAKLATGVPTINFENRYRRKDGTYLWLAWVSVPDADGKLYAIARDVTEAKNAAVALQATNQFLDAIIDNMPGIVIVKETHSLSYTRVNCACERLLGAGSSELLGKSDQNFFTPGAAAEQALADRQALSSGLASEPSIHWIETAAGERAVLIKRVPLLGPDGTAHHLLSIWEDVTARQLYEAENARLSAIVSTTEDAIIGMNIDGTVTSWNQSAERTFGLSAEEIVGHSYYQLLPEQQRANEQQLIERIRRGERIAPYEARKRRKDGREIDVAVTMSRISDKTGALKGVSKIVRDISQAKALQRELVQAKDHAEAVNRELEAFSYSVAHDLRSPLRSIDGFSRAVLEDSAHLLDDTGRRYLELVCDSAQLMASLIDDMLALSKVTRAELVFAAVDLSELARNVLSKLEPQRGQRQIEISIQEGLSAQGDVRLLAVLLQNLLGNAWKFTSKRELAKIEFGAVPSDHGLEYFVRDNGAGFDMAFASKLFGVFQRLHTTREFDGSGVGLATVQRIVSRHGGQVRADGKVDEGATFYFTLGEG